MRHTIVEEETHAGAGRDKSKEKRLRAVTLVELLYNARLIDMNMLMAADRYRTWHLELQGHSQGVSSYGDNPGGSDPTGKADRVGCHLTGYKVNGTKWIKDGRGRNFNIQEHYDAAGRAMWSVTDVEGKLATDHELKRIMIAAICHTTDIPTQTSIARIRTRYGGEKQLASAGSVPVTEALKRLVLFMKYNS